MQSNRGHMKLDRLFKKGALVVLLLVLAIGLWSPPAHAAKQVISKVDISSSANSVQIKVTASAPIALHDSRIGSRYIVFDLYGALDATQRRRVNISSGGIRFINCAWYKDSPPIARVAIAVDGHAKYSVTYENGKRLAILTVYKMGPAAKKPQMAVQAAKQISSVPAPKAYALAAVEPCVASRLAEMNHPAAQVSNSSSTSEPATADSTAASKPVEITDLAPAIVGSNAAPEAIAVREPAPVAKSVRPTPKPVMRSKPVLVASASPIRPEPVRPAKMVSLDFVASDIHDVLKALSTQGGVNIVASADVKGEVTASLNKVSVDEALKLVANLSGYQYQKRGTAYIVGTADNLKALSASDSPAQEKATAVVVLTYSDPALVTKMLQAQYSAVNVTSNESDSKTDGPRGQTVLVLNGPADSVRAAQAMVQAIEDSVGSTISESVMDIYETKYADVKELQALLAAMLPGLRVSVGPDQGFKLQCPTPVAMGTEGGSTVNPQNAITQVAQPKMLVLQGSQADIDKANEFLAKVDVPQQQIIIEAKVIDITDDASRNLGIEWGDQGIVGQLGFTESTPSQAISFGRFSRTGIDVTATIKALLKDSKAKVLANPNVMALDGKPSSIFIGDEVKYVISRDISSTTGQMTISTETARVGVQLHTISRVSSDGYITMDLHPEVSVITSFLDAGNGILLPQISRRFVDSTVRIKDGETIVIGGLIKDDDLKTVTGVPILMNLPIIGELFRSHKISKVHSEVMMFITPKVTKDIQ